MSLVTSFDVVSNQAHCTNYNGSYDMTVLVLTYPIVYKYWNFIFMYVENKHESLKHIFGKKYKKKHIAIEYHNVNKLQINNNFPQINSLTVHVKT